MDSSHMGLIHQYSTSNTNANNNNASRPIPTRTQSEAQPSNTPDFEFSLPSVRPGLAKIGRRISEMSDNFLYESDVTNNEPSLSRSVSKRGVPRIPEERPVPFMGDEPVFCPFCEKPLPPGLLAQHAHTLEEEKERFKKTPTSNTKRESIGMTKTTSAPESSKTGSTSKPLLGALTVKREPPVALDGPRMTSVELGKPVKAADEVDNAASKVEISTEDLRRWATIAGIELDLPKAPEKDIEPETTGKKEEPKPFPKLAPPPEDKVSSRSSSRFGFFKGKSSKGDEDDESDDDDMGGPGGYARLDAPASPERIEKELGPPERRGREGGTESTPVLEEKAVEPQPASEEELRKALKEVLEKVNTMAKSHASLLHSHSTVLTTLKITRSNLAMAEANAEMLEEQLKRQSTPASAVRPNPTPNSAMGPPRIPRPSAPTRTTTTPAPAPNNGVAAGSTPLTRQSAESARPQSIQIPNSNNNPRTPISASSESGTGVFGSFWSRNKDRVGEFMSNIPDLTPTAERSSYDFARSPTSPAMTQSMTAGAPGLGRSKTVHGRAGESDSMQRSSSYTNVRNNVLKEAAGVPRQPSDPYTQELTRLRTAHTTAQAKIDSMSKELADLKKGKVEMEAELENLSQALFEEANKMVADERKKRAELEESLKEVKEEREALRETIKVLGGQVEDMSSQGDGSEAGAEEKDQVGQLPDFQPRDLDKHYEALRKSIHHVSDNQWEESGGEQGKLEALAKTTASPSYSAPSNPRRHSLPDIASPEPPAAPALHDPWADSANTSVAPPRVDTGSPTSSRDDDAESESRSARSVKLDDMDSYMEQLQADIELESPKRGKVNL